VPPAVSPLMGNGALPGSPDFTITGTITTWTASFIKTAVQQLLQIGMLYFKRDYDDIMQVDFGIKRKKIKDQST
jgi:hypothetical protein